MDEKAPAPAGAVAARTGPDPVGLLAGLTTVVLWGSAFVAIRAAGDGLSPGGIALARLIVSTTILSAVALVRRESLPARRDLLVIAVYGVLWLGVYTSP
jgi:drug/metabolite transporter (DMT)-like permease